MRANREDGFRSPTGPNRTRSDRSALLLTCSWWLHDLPSVLPHRRNRITQKVRSLRLPHLGFKYAGNSPLNRYQNRGTDHAM